MGSFQDYRLIAKNPPHADTGPWKKRSEVFPERVGRQVLYVLEATLGSGDFADYAWRAIVGRYDYEMGTSNLGQGEGIPAGSAVEDAIGSGGGLGALDVIALALLWAKDKDTYRSVAAYPETSLTPQRGVDEVNRFFREADVPYQFEQDVWVHVASGYVHAEIVRPALDVLGRPGFEGALVEFKSALGHARDRQDKAAVTEATKAVESTMKCICTARGWIYPENTTAKPLFDLLAQNGLVPAWMEHAIIPVATMRNKKSAHGQGPTREALPPYAADLAVNLAASSILALMAAHGAA